MVIKRDSASRDNNHNTTPNIEKKIHLKKLISLFHDRLLLADLYTGRISTICSQRMRTHLTQQHYNLF
jgi:hypothetical protein